MADQPLYWVVPRNARGKWVVMYDPKYEVKDGKRFAYEAWANEYQKKMTKKDADAAKAVAESQSEFPLGDRDV